MQNIKKEYPESEISEIVKILNEEEKINADILKNYGINLEKEAIKTHMFHHVLIKKIFPFVNRKEKASIKEAIGKALQKRQGN